MKNIVFLISCCFYFKLSSQLKTGGVAAGLNTFNFARNAFVPGISYDFSVLYYSKDKSTVVPKIELDRYSRSIKHSNAVSEGYTSAISVGSNFYIPHNSFKKNQVAFHYFSCMISYYSYYITSTINYANPIYGTVQEKYLKSGNQAALNLGWYIRFKPAKNFEIAYETNLFLLFKKLPNITGYDSDLGLNYIASRPQLKLHLLYHFGITKK